jgi:capsular polysaccharide biosynthesis protein
MYKNELEIDVFRCIKALFKKWLFILIITALFFAVGLGLSLNVGDDQYTSVATVYAAADTSYTDAANAVTAMNAYLDVATSYKVSQRAALIMGRNDIDATEIQEALTVTSSLKKTGTSSVVTNFMTSSATIISLSATTPAPELSMEIADAAAESYTIEMANILKTDAVKKLDSASEAYMTVNASQEAIKNILKIMIVGFVLACAVVIACEIVDSKVRTIREATIREELPIIGIIPDYKE